MIQTTVDESNENVRDNSFLPITTDTIKPPYASIKNPIYTRDVDFQKTQKVKGGGGKDSTVHTSSIPISLQQGEKKLKLLRIGSH